jgi:hypothetical protein
MSKKKKGKKKRERKKEQNKQKEGKKNELTALLSQQFDSELCTLSCSSRHHRRD